MLALVGALVLSGPANVQFLLTPQAPHGRVTGGETVVVASLRNDSDRERHFSLQWRIRSTHTDQAASPSATVTLAKGARLQFRQPVRLPKPGFAEVIATLTEFPAPPSPSGSSWGGGLGGRGNASSLSARVYREPEKLRSRLTRAPDFDAYWRDSLAQLQRVPMQAEVVPVEPGLFRVNLRSHGNVRVSGWLELPPGPGPHPVVVRVPGYTEDLRPLREWKDLAVFSFSIRGHGISQQDVSGQPEDYWIRGLDEKQGYFYQGAYLDVVRAVDFVASRADLDPKRITIWGGSQGGGLALAGAALDSRIDLCIADIPFLCDWVDYFKLSDWPEMDAWIAARPTRSWPSTLRTLSYFDTMNLADRIRCPVYMAVGLQDPICPPSTSIAAFNRIRSRKHLWIDPRAEHGLDDAHYTRTWDTIRHEFGLDRLPLN